MWNSFGGKADKFVYFVTLIANKSLKLSNLHNKVKVVGNQWNLAIVTVRRWIHLCPFVDPYRPMQRVFDEIMNNRTVTQCSHQRAFDQFVQFRISGLDITRQIPWQMHHGNNRLHALDLVVLIPLDGQLILAPRQRANIPCDIVAPTLHAVDRARVHLTSAIKRQISDKVHRLVDARQQVLLIDDKHRTERASRNKFQRREYDLKMSYSLEDKCKQRHGSHRKSSKSETC